MTSGYGEMHDDDDDDEEEDGKDGRWSRILREKPGDEIHARKRKRQGGVWQL